MWFKVLKNSFKNAGKEIKFSSTGTKEENIHKSNRCQHEFIVDLKIIGLNIRFLAYMLLIQSSANQDTSLVQKKMSLHQGLLRTFSLPFFIFINAPKKKR